MDTVAVAVFLGTFVLGFVAILDISASDVLGIGSRAGRYALWCVDHALGAEPDDDDALGAEPDDDDALGAEPDDDDDDPFDNGWTWAA